MLVTEPSAMVENKKAECGSQSLDIPSSLPVFGVVALSGEGTGDSGTLGQGT